MSQPNKKTETEIVIYARLKSIDGLDESIRTIEQTQYSCVNGPLVSRVRMTKIRKAPEGEPTGIRYELTTKQKLKSDGVQTSTEENDEICETNYKALAVIFGRTNREYVCKIRHEFKTKRVGINYIDHTGEVVTLQLPDTKFELDVFKRSDGNYSEWVKLDIEVDEILKVLNDKYPKIKQYKLNVSLDNLPLELEDHIVMSEANHEQRDFVRKLWSEEFTIKF